MIECYCADPAVQAAILETLESYGLVPCPTAYSRRPGPALTLDQQMERILLTVRVIADVRRRVRIGEPDRALIERLVHSGCQRIEDQGGSLPAPAGRMDAPHPPRTTNPTRRPAGPDRPSSPTKTNPTRAIRSSRWSAAGKGVRS